jgi:glucosyl-dolichyl phosphate glucuronosyltransferase
MRATGMTDSETQSFAERSVTAILCTYNRCGVLGGTLARLAASQLPPSVTWEILILDNNSTDQTRVVAEEFCGKYPGVFRYVFEPVSGKSYALNRGVKEARGAVLAFVDDDVTVEPTWLHNLTSSLHDGKWAGSGGRTLPAQAFSAPDWFSVKEFGGLLFGGFDFGDQRCELAHAPFGANMAFRKEMFAKYGGFRTDLGPGPNPDIPRPNEDTEFGRRLMAAGEHLLYEPNAVLYHPVELAKLDRQFLLAWHVDYGRAFARELENRPASWGIRHNYWSMLKAIGYRLPLGCARWMLSFHAQNRFRRKCELWRVAGQTLETYRRCFGDQQKTLVTAP